MNNLSNGSGANGGDKALVFDFGHYSIRAGYAGESQPTDIPTMAGVYEEISLDSDNSASASSISEKDYFIGTTSIHDPCKKMHMLSCLKDGMIENWDLFEHVLDHIYGEIKAKSHLHPVLMSETSWNTQSKREQLIELMYETFNVPTFCVIKNAVLAAYANNCTTGIVVDSGASQTSAVPVHEGFVISKEIVKSPLAGDFLSVQCKKYLERIGVDVTPPYMIESKEVVQKNAPAKWVVKRDLPKVGKSWHTYMVKEVLQDFQSSVLQVSKTQIDKEVIKNLSIVHYEFPNGYNQDFGAERFQIPETMFNPPNIQGITGIAEMVTKSVELCDNDVRPSMYRKVILTGGNTLIPGFYERLNQDLSARTPPSIQPKIISKDIKEQQRFGAWIGGSIMASLENTHQMWIKKQEYDEEGKTRVAEKYLEISPFGLV